MMITLLLCFILLVLVSILIFDLMYTDQWNWLSRQFRRKYQVCSSDGYRIMLYILRQGNGTQEFAFYIEKKVVPFIWISVDEVRWYYPDMEGWSLGSLALTDIKVTGLTILQEFKKTLSSSKKSDKLLLKYLKNRNQENG